MIIGIGCDTVDHSITEKLEWGTNHQIRARIFSINELKLLPFQNLHHIAFLAGRFAIKEAVLKCLGTGMVDGISLKEIETLNDIRRKPTIYLNGDVLRMANEKGIAIWHVSLTHTIKYTTAFVIAEK